MPRHGRYFLEGQPLHVMQRGNNKGNIFFTHQDAVNFLKWLGEAADTHDLSVHAYVLMPNHIHLLASPGRPESVPRTMQTLGRRYVGHINGLHARTGTLWEGRYRAAVVDTDAYFFRCSRYIELNPVRAGLVKDPGSYPWSSYGANAQGASDPLVKQHTSYLGLNSSAAARAADYREMFREGLDEKTLKSIRDATNGNWALGDEAFKAHIAKLSGMRTEPRPRGRPKTLVEHAIKARGFLE
ncbi:MAG: transposase [Rhodospirillaceae bacterium]|nr:transposase [Rhodospirillaceae bacterium]